MEDMNVNEVELYKAGAMEKAEPEIREMSISEILEIGTLHFNWTKEATKLLIREYGLWKSQIDDGKVKKKHVWAATANVLSKHGFNVTPVQCENKWKGLTRRYRAAMTNNSKTSPLLDFQEELEELYSKDHSNENDSETPAIALQTPEEEEEGVNSFTWTKKATKLLIHEYSLWKPQMENGEIKKKHAWAAIADAVTEKGFAATPMQCENKWKGITRRYKSVSDTSTTKCSPLFVTFQEELDGLFRKDHTIMPITTASSSEGIAGQIGATPHLYDDSSTSRSRSNSESESSSSTPLPPSSITHQATRGRKRKREAMPDWFVQYNEIQERRHKERLECMEKSMEIFRDVLTMALNRLTKT